jgi:hypothetical protein
MASSVDSGFTFSWPASGRAIFAYVVGAAIIISVALFANGLGLVTSKHLSDSVSESESERGQSLSGGLVGPDGESLDKGHFVVATAQPGGATAPTSVPGMRVVPLRPQVSAVPQRK